MKDRDHCGRRSRSMTWLPTYETLHRWVQVVGKTRLKLAPFENHWWHAALYVTARGITTSPMPYAHGTIEIEFNILGDALLAHTSEGESRAFVWKRSPWRPSIVNTASYSTCSAWM